MFLQIIVSLSTGMEFIALSDQELVIVPTSAAEQEPAAWKSNVHRVPSRNKQLVKPKSKTLQR
jgi:hypothetical protein